MSYPPSPYFSDLTRERFCSLAAVPQPEYFVGLDLGQARDHTAIAILEVSTEVLDRDFATYEWNTVTHRSLRHLERLPLGLDYPSMVEHVRDLVSRPEISRRCTLIVDATGVGRPVVDMLSASQLPCPVIPVTITGGDSETSEGSHWRVPKRNLISGLIVLFQRGDLDICGHLPDSETLVRELANMRIKVSLNGQDTYGAWREGEHDDLVLAASLACWRGAFFKQRQ